jgi:hypothetical protein
VTAAAGKAALRKARAIRANMGYDPSPPLCRNCKRFVPEMKPTEWSKVHVLPFCGACGQNVSPFGVCDFWLGDQGATLEPGT